MCSSFLVKLCNKERYRMLWRWWEVWMGLSERTSLGRDNWPGIWRINRRWPEEGMEQCSRQRLPDGGEGWAAASERTWEKPRTARSQGHPGQAWGRHWAGGRCDRTQEFVFILRPKEVMRVGRSLLKATVSFLESSLPGPGNRWWWTGMVVMETETWRWNGRFGGGMYNPRHHIFCVFTEQIHQLMAFLMYRTDG